MNSNEMIDCKFWRDVFCETEFRTGGTLPEGGLVYVNIEHIKEFFEKCKQTDRKYTVVSGYSDYGLAKQEEHPVSLDMIKWFPFVSEEIMQSRYEDLFIPARCDKELCDYYDTYSIKCYSATHSTLNEIPSNIDKWYVVNLMLEHDRIEGIPMGVAADEVRLVSQVKNEKIKQDKLLYINWQLYTNERVQLKQHFVQSKFPWATVRKEPTLPQDEYLREMASHRFILCPEGNGVDCHRIWEALYLGCIPIVVDSKTTACFDGLPIIRINSLYYVTEEVLTNILEQIGDEPKDYSKASISYWTKRIKG